MRASILASLLPRLPLCMASCVILCERPPAFLCRSSLRNLVDDFEEFNRENDGIGLALTDQNLAGFGRPYFPLFPPPSFSVCMRIPRNMRSGSRH